MYRCLCPLSLSLSLFSILPSIPNSDPPAASATLSRALQMSLAVMQNQLCESVHHSRSNSALAASRHQEMEQHGRVSFGSLGSVAIVSRKLETDD